MKFALPAALLALTALGPKCAGAGEESAAGSSRFTGSPSCASTSCHGGGTGRNEAVLFQRADKHTVAAGLLEKGTSLRIAEALRITGNPLQSERCNVCHAPLQGVPLDHLLPAAREEHGFACETCHGPAENWLRFHTRGDVTFPQIVAAGMRNLNDLYGRANTCVGCHANLDPALETAGHPQLTFELDGQTQSEPPHYKDARPSLGPRSWLTGQATALRELSARLAQAREPGLLPRWRALARLLRRTEAGRKALPAGEDFAAMQKAADQLARSAAATLWSKEQVKALLLELVKSSGEFSVAKANPDELRSYAELLVPAIDRLWRAWQKESGAASPEFETALGDAFTAARMGQDFKAAEFAAELQRVREAFGQQ